MLLFYLYVKIEIHFYGATCSKNGVLDYSKRTLIMKSSLNSSSSKYCCSLNLTLEKGIYHFIFKIESSHFQIGVDKYISRNYSEDDDMKFYWDSKSNNSIEITNNKYEVIYDMNKRTFNIKDKNGVIHTLVTNIKTGIPFVALYLGYCKLLKSWIE